MQRRETESILRPKAVQERNGFPRALPEADMSKSIPGRSIERVRLALFPHAPGTLWVWSLCDEAKEFLRVRTALLQSIRLQWLAVRSVLHHGVWFIGNGSHRA